MLNKLNELLKVGVDPKWIVMLAWLVGVQKGIGQGAISLTNMIPESWIPHVIAWNNGLAWLGVGLMGLLAALSSSSAGPLISVPNIALPSVDATKTVAKILLVAFALSFLVAGGSAQAQIKLKPLTGNIVRDLTPAPSVAKDTSNIMDATISALSKPFTDIANFIGSDAAQAVALSTAVPELQDGHGQMCWQAMSTFGSVIKAHPVPITLHVMFDYETLRLLAIATNQLCTNVHCTQVFADASSMAQAASPMPLVIPTLHDLCTKVPQIALVPPQAILPTPAAPTPAPQ